MILDLVPDTDPILRAVAAPVEDIDAAMRHLLVDMEATMRHHRALGIAAPQVGRSVRVIVIARENKSLYMVNPVIIGLSLVKAVRSEGCLSLPGRILEISRPNQVRVSYVDKQGEPRTIVAGGVHATAIQHEIDHLDGVLMTDYQQENENG